jgi:tight adherence protein C
VRIDPFVLLAILLAIATATALVNGVLAAVRSGDVIARRLAPEASADAPPRAAAPAEPSGPPLLARLLEPLARVARPLRTEELAKVRDDLVRAGLRQAHALQYFLATKIVLGSGLLGVALWVNAQRAHRVQPALFLALLAFSLGYYAPALWVSSRASARKAAIERGLPDALDLLVTCVEAGLGLDAALQRVSQEIRLPWPILGGELHETFLEAKAGIPRVEAFRRLAHRTGVPDLKSLAATLTQTELFGTSVALALRVQAEGMRTRRMQRAEERAAYVGVKMTIPLILFILPSMVAIVVGPAAINIAAHLASGVGR